MNTQAQQETLGFQAEVAQLLELVAKSLYSNKEIFLRELISNASDAADKLRYEALSDNALYEGNSELKIWISFDKDKQILTIRDNGIGMSRQEAVENLGTIAKSGTKAFRELLEAEKTTDSQLIGQFGVGFYSAFIVADKVVVRSRRAGMTADQGVEWESDGKGQFTVKNIDQPSRGTEIELHLKKEEDDFLSDVRLRTVITKYSDHILLPIMMGEEVVNSAKALWTLPKSQIKNEEYEEFYQQIFNDFEAPLTWSHNRVEGKLEYTSLLYIPARAPFDLWMREHRRGFKLYVKRVFIMDDAEHFMPTYLRFVKGIIDSNDLPLNISREILQSNRMIDLMKSACVKRVLDLLEDLAENKKETYQKFWNEFGEVLKEGPAEDFANKDRISKLLRFSTTHDDRSEQAISLDEYVSRMKEAQDAIYYLTADNFLAAKNSPLLEVFRKKNIEVLLLSDRVDEWLLNSFTEYEGKKLVSIAKGNLDLGKLDDEASKKEQAEKEKDYEGLVEKIQAILKDEVKEVRLTHRLTDSPSCVVFDENALSGHMERLLQSAGQQIDRTKPILELNPDHAIIKRAKEDSELQLRRWSRVLLSQALIAEGESLQNPAEFVRELNLLLTDLKS